MLEKFILVFIFLHGNIIKMDSYISGYLDLFVMYFFAPFVLYVACKEIGGREIPLNWYCL